MKVVEASVISLARLITTTEAVIIVLNYTFFEENNDKRTIERTGHSLTALLVEIIHCAYRLAQIS